MVAPSLYVKLYTDGACDDEVTALAWEIRHEDGVEIGSRYMLGDYTSMEAEYYALLDGLRHARKYGDEIEAFSDCEPMVQKMRIPDANNQDWYDRRQGCHRLLNKFDSWELEWTPRSQNTSADREAYEALERGRRAAD